jgi:phosphatidylinositol 4-kinase
MLRYMQSLAGYSVITYLLAIKDRHNGNIMLNREGRLIHIDFGFVLGIAPGKQFSFERAPFKLTQEMCDVLGGRNSPLFEEFVRLCTDALMYVPLA